MKKGMIICMGVIFTGSLGAFAQNPVHWSYQARAIGGQKFEVRLTATIEEGWHIYAQKQPGDAIAAPTVIRFLDNPLLQLEGGVKEVGNLEAHMDKSLGIGANQYERKVDFVQIIKVKGKLQTDIQGTIQFQVCTDHECLPPTVTHFDIPLKG
jgi:DsbC/DsbD-like thiol-disulfide interchange protein